MTIKAMRKAVMDLYDGIGWKNRVSRMKDEQVIAIYKQSEKYDRFHKRAEEMNARNYQQMTIFDYIQ